MKALEVSRKTTNLEFSLGLILDSETGLVQDVVFGKPAAEAGIAPGMTLVAVNGRAWTPEVIHEALKAGKNNTDALELLIRNTGYYSTVRVPYHEGDRYPHFVRNDRPDLLGNIIRPHAASMR